MTTPDIPDYDNLMSPPEQCEDGCSECDDQHTTACEYYKGE